jgi:hypothetical protein
MDDRRWTTDGSDLHRLSSIVKCRLKMIQHPPPTEAQQQLALRYQLAAQAAKSYFQAGFTVVYQDIIILSADLENELSGLRPFCYTCQPHNPFNLLPKSADSNSPALPRANPARTRLPAIRVRIIDRDAEANPAQVALAAGHDPIGD